MASHRFFRLIVILSLFLFLQETSHASFEKIFRICRGIFFGSTENKVGFTNISLSDVEQLHVEEADILSHIRLVNAEIELTVGNTLLEKKIVSPDEQISLALSTAQSALREFEETGEVSGITEDRLAYFVDRMVKRKYIKIRPPEDEETANGMRDYKESFINLLKNQIHTFKKVLAHQTYLLYLNTRLDCHNDYIASYNSKGSENLKRATAEYDAQEFIFDQLMEECWEKVKKSHAISTRITSQTLETVSIAESRLLNLQEVFEAELRLRQELLRGELTAVAEDHKNLESRYAALLKKAPARRMRTLQYYFALRKKLFAGLESQAAVDALQGLEKIYP